jgi:dienelactone hydrolase
MARRLPALLSLAVGLSGGTALGQTLSVEPSEIRVDEALRIRARGLEPGTRLMITASTEDASGASWNAFAGYESGPDGTVDLDRDAPLHGSYSGVDPMGLVRGMAPRPGATMGRFQVDWQSPLTIVFRLWIDRQVVATTEAKLRHLDPGVTVHELNEGGLIGKLFLPSAPRPAPAVLVLGGSEGGLGAADEAALLAGHGLAALALAYFGVEGLPEELAEIPLETFERGLRWLATRPEVAADRIGIVGSSKGAEAALLIASETPSLRALVAYAPTHVSWACICDERDLPSWTRNGLAVPFVPGRLDPSYPSAGAFAISPRVHYQYRLASAGRIEPIAIEEIAAPMLLISGRDDGMWPATQMAEAIVEQARRNGNNEVEHLAYAGAGHFIPKTYLPLAGLDRIAGGRLLVGGTRAATARARDDSWPRVLEFLRSSLAPEE